MVGIYIFDLDRKVCVSPHTSQTLPPHNFLWLKNCIASKYCNFVEAALLGDTGITVITNNADKHKA